MVPSFVRSGARRIAKLFLTDYIIFRIYAWKGPPSVASSPAGVECGRLLRVADLATSDDPELRALAEYAGADAVGYAARLNGQIVAGCWFWSGERYAKERGFWPLGPGEAKLVQITTAAVARGRGIAPALIEYAACDLIQRFERLYARIWHTNIASIRAFEKAGWVRIATVVEIEPRLIPRRFRFVRRV